MKCDQKMMNVHVKKITIKKKNPIPLTGHPNHLSLTLNRLIPCSWHFLKSVLEVIFWNLCDCLDVLNWFKIFTFHPYFDFGEEPKVMLCQIWWAHGWQYILRFQSDNSCHTRSNVWYGILPYWRIKQFTHFSSHFLHKQFLKYSNDPL